jgi:hypothetical protein
MLDLPLDVCKYLTGVGLIPAPIEVLGGQAELDDEIAREVFRLDLAPLLTPKAEESILIVAHNDPGIRPADEMASVTDVD